MNFFSVLYNIADFPSKIIHKAKVISLKKGLFKSCGKNFMIGVGFVIRGYKNISIGDNAALGAYCIMFAQNAPLRIGNNVMFGPHVTIMTGDHRTDLIGEYMRFVGEDKKIPENDKPVIIEDDVWIGSNVTILKGTTIGRGSIIHAGNVISGRIKPYTIYIDKKIKMSRFSDAEIQEHEKSIKEKYGVEYPEYHPRERLFG